METDGKHVRDLQTHKGVKKGGNVFRSDVRKETGRLSLGHFSGRCL